MATATGLRTLFGVGDETTYGTAVAITRRLEFVSESLARENTILQPEGIDGVRTSRRGSRRVVSAEMGGGDVTFEVPYTGFGLLLKHMVGGTPTIVQQGATIAWLQTHAQGSLTGKSLTVQKSLRDGDGTEVETFTFAGCKVTQWQLSISVDQILQATLSFDAQKVVTNVANTALAALAVPTSPLFNFKQGSLLVAATPVARVLEATLTGNNSLKTDSFFLGSAGLKAEPEITGFRTLDGTLTAEFTDPAVFYDRFAADTGVALQLDFTGPIIASTHAYRLRIDVPDIRFTGETPQVGGPDVVMNNAPFEAAVDASGNPLCTFTYMSIDTAI